MGHIGPLFQLQPYQAVDAIGGLSVPDMSDHCLESTVERILKSDVFG